MLNIDSITLRFCRLSRDPVDALVKVTEQRWNDITAKLNFITSKLKQLNPDLDLSKPAKVSSQIQGIPTNIVITANPANPPAALPGLVKMLSEDGLVIATTHVHSSVKNLPGNLLDFLVINEGVPRSKSKYAITFIWSANEESLSISAQGSNLKICGEIDSVRYFSRLLKNKLPYDDLSTEESAFIDAQLDLMSSSTLPLDQAEKALKKFDWISGKEFSIADIILWSRLRANKASKLSAPLQKWKIKCDKILC